MQPALAGCATSKVGGLKSMAGGAWRIAVALQRRHRRYRSKSKTLYVSERTDYGDVKALFSMFGIYFHWLYIYSLVPCFGQSNVVSKDIVLCPHQQSKANGVEHQAASKKQ